MQIGFNDREQTQRINREDETEFCEKYIRILGYKCSEYTVTTADGFILNLQRVGMDERTNDNANQNRKGLRFPVLLDHAMFLGGDAWFNLLPDQMNDKNLPLILSKHGFDVWISNHRGTKYSFKHTQQMPSSRAFWDWSFDELAALDLPAMIQLILNETKVEKVHLVGFNQGGMLPIILASTKPNLARALESLVLIAPAVYFTKPTSPTIRNWVNLAPDQIIYLFGIERGRFNFTVVLNFLSYFSNLGIPLHQLVTVGSTANEMITNVTGPYCCLEKPASVALNKTDSNWVVGSYRNLAHYQQEMRTLKFQAWNYGNDISNMISYSSSTPPEYFPSMVPDHLPVMVVNGGNDWFVNVNNTNRLISEFRGKVNHLFLPQYSHLDLLYSESIERDVCDPIAEYLKEGYLAN